MALVFVILALLWAGLRIEWSRHLLGDVQYYFAIASYFWGHHSLVGFPQALLYPPTANLLFLVLALPTLVVSDFNVFLGGLVVVNILLIATLYYFFKGRVLSLTGASIFLVSILLSGPLVLYRFDLLIMLLLVLAIYFFNQGKYLYSSLCLGTATGLKVFPIIILPYFLLVAARKGGKTPMAKMVGGFIGAVVGWSVVYILVTGLSLGTVIDGLAFNITKAVHIESVWGSVLTLVTWVRYGQLFTIDFTNGVFALPFYYTLGHFRVFRFVSLGALVLVYGLLWWRRKSLGSRLDGGVVALIILTLLSTTQVLSPQYLLWPIILLPFLSAKELASQFWRTNAIIYGLMLAFTQFVYPLNYDYLIFNFYNGNGLNNQVFWTLAARNGLLVLLTARLLVFKVFKKSYAGAS